MGLWPARPAVVRHAPVMPESARQYKRNPLTSYRKIRTRPCPPSSSRSPCCVRLSAVSDRASTSTRSGASRAILRIVPSGAVPQQSNHVDTQTMTRCGQIVPLEPTALVGGQPIGQVVFDEVLFGECEKIAAAFIADVVALDLRRFRFTHLSQEIASGRCHGRFISHHDVELLLTSNSAKPRRICSSIARKAAQSRNGGNVLIPHAITLTPASLDAHAILLTDEAP